MFKHIFTLITFWGVWGWAQMGIVDVQSSYLDYMFPNKQISFQGKGFVVDYQVISKTTQKKANLKVVLTAAHLVFGGIYEKRLDNFKVFESDSKKELSALAMVSDVIHDTASIILCTQEAMNFFKEELLTQNYPIDELVNLEGQRFILGGGCTSKGLGKIVHDTASFAYFKGKPIVLDSTPNYDNNGVWTISEKELKESEIIVYEDKKIKFKEAQKTYAVPAVNPSVEPLISVEELKERLSQSQITKYSSLDEVPAEYRIPLRLPQGYSGSPLLSYDAVSDKVVIIGIYKSSTQTGESEAYADYGWVVPSELNFGLLNILLNRYGKTLHRWHTIPQAYLYLNDGQLKREIRYDGFILTEDYRIYLNGQESLNKDNQNIWNRSDTGETSWVRSDTGETVWVRSDTGDLVSSEPRSSYPLSGLSSNDGTQWYLQDLLFIILVDDPKKEYILLPPVINSVPFITKYNCSSCINSGPLLWKKDVVWGFNSEEYIFIHDFWRILESKNAKKARQGHIDRVFINSNTESQTGHITISYFKEIDRIKIQLSWSQGNTSLEDQFVFYILKNNNFYFQNKKGEWIESTYPSVIQSLTSLQKFPLLLETAGIIYYNTELPNPDSFRFKLKNKETELFSLKK